MDQTGEKVLDTQGEPKELTPQEKAAITKAAKKAAAEGTESQDSNIANLVAELVAKQMEAYTATQAVEKVKVDAVIAAPEPRKMVKIRLFKDKDNYKDDVFASVNGEAWQIKRGVTVEVPDYIAAVLDNSQLQDEATSDKIEAAIALGTVAAAATK